MKKTTLIALFAFLTTSLSNAQIIDSENFESTALDLLPTNWTTTTTTIQIFKVPDFKVSDIHKGCNDTKSVISNLYTNNQDFSLTSPTYTNLTSSTIKVSYQLRVFIHDTSTPVSSSFGTISLFYSLDNGTNWTSLGTVDNTNFTPQTNCQTIEYILPAANIVSNSQLKFKWNALYSGTGDYDLSIDNFKVEYSGTASTRELNKSNLQVYPNPVGQQLNIDYDLNIIKLSIFDLSGRNIGVYSSNESINSIDVSSLNSGTYLLNIEAADHSESTIKFVKK